MKTSKCFLSMIAAVTALSPTVSTMGLQVNISGQGSCPMFFDEMRWQHRILLVHTDSEQESKELTEDLDNRSTEISARTLLVIEANTRSAHILNRSLLCNPSPHEVNRRLNTNKAVLIGLDGYTKERYDVVDLVRVFSDIDAMPMRQSERR
ncbi:DUF4174 domain-containing protein [Alteromonas sp. A081]|uniref:DUF4174 domain-containing protein n=1 Tax=Alteromonas sp. A081 TaxID=3410269 RepID=UPI003B984333